MELEINDYRNIVALLASGTFQLNGQQIRSYNQLMAKLHQTIQSLQEEEKPKA